MEYSVGAGKQKQQCKVCGEKKMEYSVGVGKQKQQCKVCGE